MKMFLSTGHASLQAAAEKIVANWETGDLSASVRELSTALQQIEALNKEQNSRTFKALRKAADREYGREGEIEVDDNAVVSRADGNPEHGAYVAAWVWVSDSEK